MINHKEYLAIGKIHSPFALKGGVKIYYYSDSCEHFINLKNKSILMLRKNLVTKLLVIRVEIKGDWPIFFFSDYNNPEVALSQLKGGEIYVSRNLATPLKEDEFYLCDLLGLNIFYNEKYLGICINYFESSSIVIEVKTLEGRHMFFPFVEKYFDSPDFIHKKVNLLSEDLLK